jgi:hypothetical protein
LCHEEKQNLASWGTGQRTTSTQTESSPAHVGLYFATTADREIFNHIQFIPAGEQTEMACLLKLRQEHQEREQKREHERQENEHRERLAAQPTAQWQITPIGWTNCQKPRVNAGIASR